MSEIDKTQVVVDVIDKLINSSPTKDGKINGEDIAPMTCAGAGAAASFIGFAGVGPLWLRSKGRKQKPVGNSRGKSMKPHRKKRIFSDNSFRPDTRGSSYNQGCDLNLKPKPLGKRWPAALSDGACIPQTNSNASPEELLKGCEHVLEDHFCLIEAEQVKSFMNNRLLLELVSESFNVCQPQSAMVYNFISK